MKASIVNFFDRNIRAKVLVTYTIAVIFVTSIFYKLVPILLNYAPGYAYIDKLHGLSYTWQFVIMILLGLLIGFVIIIFSMRGVKEIERYVNQPGRPVPENLQKMKRKLLNLPYHIYIIQIAVAAVMVTFLVLPLFVLENASLSVFFRVFLLVIIFFTLVSNITLVISQNSIRKLLLKLESDTNIDGFRLNIVVKLFLQVLPIFIIATSITSLIGYSKNIEDKGNLICDSYMEALQESFSEYRGTILTMEQIEGILYHIKPVVDQEDIRFIITPDKKIITSDQKPLGDYFQEYLWRLALKNGGYVYDVTGEIRGAVVTVAGVDGTYVAGIKFNIISDNLVIFYIIGFLFILFICSIVLYFLSKAMSDDILTVAKRMNEIASNEYISLDRRLPITSNDETSDLVIAFNKIQQLVQKNIDQIRDNQEILIQQERMASLGQLIGGIAHSLKTPISTASDAAFCIEKLAEEYDNSIDSKVVTHEDHHAIAGEIKGHVADLKETLNYINSVINMVKNHAADLDKLEDEQFPIKDLIKGINILMANELRKNDCRLEIHTNMADEDKIAGSIGNLIQVIEVLISNAIEAYPDGDGQIDLNILRLPDKIEISVQDYGMGIPKNIQDKLLNKMVTTKGSKGTGIGLYISNSTIKAKFNGSLRFLSKEGIGTKFYITLPIRKEGFNYANQEYDK
jgi:Signal transduction histidine kinase